MLKMPVTLMGMVGSAFMVASFVPGAIGQANSETTASAIRHSQTVVTAGKSGRISAPSASAARHTVSIIEIVGVSRAAVVLKDHNGNVLFRSDPQTNTTYFSRDTDLPVLTMREEDARDVRLQPVSRQSSDDSTVTKRRTQPHGCIGAVSPLAQAGKDAAPSLCVTRLEADISWEG